MRIYCGEVNESLLNKEIELFGWIKRSRKFGGLIFIDLYDKTGIVQLVLDQNNKLYNEILHISKESVVRVVGKVVLRSNPNPELATGKYEIILNDIEIISKAENTPFVIEENADANEDIRLKYRYLDLRRNVIKSKIQLRSKVIQSIRNYLINNRFEEVETPFLCRPTPEGAKDYLVPTRNKKEAFYALPQSPQTFKQLLMVAGFDRYFQIARCFRDEPLRSDRQPEFTQVDMELSFTNELEIQTIVEGLLKNVFKEALNIDLQTPFIRMDYNEAMNKYGCDKPDLRFGNEIIDFSNYFKETNFKIFKSVLDNNNSINGLIFKDFNLTKNEIAKIEKFAKDNKAKGLAWLNIENKKIIAGSIANVIEHEIINKIISDYGIEKATIFFVADTKEICLKSLGAVRLETARLLKLIPEDKYCFAWIVNWPLYEYDEEENRYVAAHHPFTSPTLDCIDSFDSDKKNAKARSYDIVLNGYEIGGGSIRINNPEIQNRMFKSLNLDENMINEKFGFLIEAFKYGVPTHGGLALGLDRLLMIMTNSESIKDVIAFPKNSTGYDLMLDGPNKLSNDELSELGLQYLNENKK